MNIGRRDFMLMGALASTCGLSACAGADAGSPMRAEDVFVTGQLFRNERYRETVSSLLISSDEKNIVVMTEKYHYVFDAPPELVAALKAPFHAAITGYLGTLHVKGSGASVIRYELALNKNASQEDREQALSAGFKASTGTSNRLSIQGDLRGTRFASNGVQPPAQSPLLLNRTYVVSVNAELSPAEISGRALLTPITLTADGALVLGMVAVGILLLPLLLVFKDVIAGGGALGVGP